MLTELALARAEAYDIERSLRGPSGPLRLLRATPNGATLVAEIAGGWRASRRSRMALQGRFVEIEVVDLDGALASALRAATYVEIAGVRYKVVEVEYPIADQRYLVRCQSTGEVA